MCCGQIAYVDVVPDAGSISRRIIRTEYRNMRAKPGCNLGDIGHQIVGSATGFLPQQPGFMRAHRIEVTEIDRLQQRVGQFCIVDDLLDEELRATVRACR
ncbi:hypothetical protein A7X57_17785 [Stenotrophomonas maltophilia]|nr:hypothetical protein A7X57_17785 [Stenotrophomonas maltophilia]